MRKPGLMIELCSPHCIFAMALYIPDPKFMRLTLDSWTPCTLQLQMRLCRGQVRHLARFRTADLKLGSPFTISLLWTMQICESYHLISQAGWNRCKLTPFYSWLMGERYKLYV